MKDGRRLRASVNRVTDDYFDVLQLRLVEGRWFTREDDVTAWNAVVLNRRMAQEIFGDESPIGKTIDEDLDDLARELTEHLVRLLLIVHFAPPADRVSMDVVHPFGP